MYSSQEGRNVLFVVTSLHDVDAILEKTHLVDAATATADLRRWRTELVRASVLVSYAASVLALDAEVLVQCRDANADVLETLIERLPSMLASAWIGGGWSLSPDASASVAAAADLTMDQAEGLLGVHTEMVASDLGDRDVVDTLLGLASEQREELVERRSRLEERIREIQGEVRRRYVTGETSVEDWLT